MDKNKDRCFYYQSGAKDLNVSFRRTLGMHLFKMRHGRKISRQKVCTELNIKSRDLDRIEIGKSNISWFMIDKLLKYYHVRLHLNLIKTSNPETTIE